MDLKWFTAFLLLEWQEDRESSLMHAASGCIQLCCVAAVRSQILSYSLSAKGFIVLDGKDYSDLGCWPIFFLKIKAFMKTKTWICDACNTEIANVDHGWVEWLVRSEGGNRIGRGLRLVHHKPHSPRAKGTGCQYNQTTERKKDGSSLLDGKLSEYVGPQGLMDLLCLLSENELPDVEVIEMIKRLHIPGYEHARKHFEAAIADEVFHQNTKAGFHAIADIKATLTWMKKKKKA